MRPECGRAAAAYRLALPGHPLGGRIGERLGQGTGSSLEFMDFRDYVPGDDLRHVDWSAFARTDQLKVRLFREEIAPSLDIVVDVSPSMAITDVKRTAVQDVVDAACSWTRSAGGIPRRIAGGGGVFETWEEVAYDGSDAWMPRIPLRRRSMRLLISDLLQPHDPGPLLRKLSAGASHLYVVQLLDPWEADPAAEGARTLLDCESDGRLDIVLDERTVARYRRRLARLCEAARSGTRSVAGTYALVRAQDPARMFREQLLPQGVVEPA